MIFYFQWNCVTDMPLLGNINGLLTKTSFVNDPSIVKIMFVLTLSMKSELCSKNLKYFKEERKSSG